VSDAGRDFFLFLVLVVCVAVLEDRAGWSLGAPASAAQGAILMLLVLAYFRAFP
jgi:hypothetical protein